VQVAPVQRSTTNGLETAVAAARAQNQSGQILDVQVTAYRIGDRAYHFITLAPANGGGVFTPMLRSMRQISAQEAAALRARQIEIVTVRAGDTPNSLARRMAFADYQLDRFLALNGLEAGAQLRAGQLVKIITYVR
jgi:predicted Zn-dependent protease